ncbi:TNF receptor-associated factor homolog 1a-like isoform X1 [Lycium barbarum]|uniref:TNF receptor-associated factor homolog 1a-like isoform X1 n=1 Tax=Lycium barbarum TaxID=112863 RepID=UPI00293F068F|nr:TNF receptor-associated factor homolog 1a-like isoform X1 [Lycium barbarum]
MASSAYEEAGTARSSEGVSSGQQQCQNSEALAEWRSSEQVENGTPSTSPPYWDCDDDDDGGPKPSELYGKYTWKIDKFSQINKRELRSNAFDVGGYKWYILIYPQGCDVCNHLSLFLCVANHDKLLPGWSHFAQFTIAVVNKDPKKSKYSDTLHRFWKKEHDWGWKKFMELSKVLDGFVDADTLIIKAQVQVIREKVERPFRCLDRQYRRELVRVYLTNVEQICRRFVEERRVKLGKLIEDRARWSSFCAFWLGMDQNYRCRMSEERSDSILKVVVKNFFIEKEVTSTLVMDSLYSGLKSLEGQMMGKKGKAKYSDAVEQLVPIVRLEKNMFVLVDDVLLLLESAALEPLPPKDEKGPQNRTKDGTSGDEFNKDSIERDERRLTELGRRTIEIFVLAQIFSKIEVAYQEAVALKRQEELIREEEAATETEQKAKRAPGKEKKSKKKQAKQKRNNQKIKDKVIDEKSAAAELYKTDQDGPICDGTYMNEEPEVVHERPDVLEAVSDVSDSIDCVPEVINPDSDDRDASPVNWDTDSSEVHPSTETSCSGLSDLSAVQNGLAGRRSPSVMDDSSSTCSTDSIPSVVLNGPWTPSNHKKQKSPSRGENQRNKSSCKAADWDSETLSQPLDAVSDVGQSDTSCRAPGSESQSTVLLSSEQRDVKKEVVASPQRKPRKAETERPSKEKSSVQSSLKSPTKDAASAVQQKSQTKTPVTRDPILVKKSSSDGPKLSDKPAQVANSSETAVMLKADPHKTVEPRVKDKPLVQAACVTAGKAPSQHVTVPATTENFKWQQVPVMSRPLSDPLVSGPRPAAPPAPVVSMVQTMPSLARSVSAAGRLGPDPSPATHSYLTQSYRNAIMGSPVSGTPPSFGQPHSPISAVNSSYSQQPPVSGSPASLGQPLSPISAVNSSHSYSQQPPVVSAALFLPQGLERTEPSSVRPSFSYGMVNNGSLQNGLQWDNNRSLSQDHPSASNGMVNNGSLQNGLQWDNNRSMSQDHPSASNGMVNNGVLQNGPQWDNNRSMSQDHPSASNGMVNNCVLQNGPQWDNNRSMSQDHTSASNGMVNNGVLQNGPQWDNNRSMSQDHPSASNGNRNFDMFKAVNSRTHDHLPDSLACASGRGPQSVAAADEFPHLDIINDLLNDDHGIGRASSIPDLGFQSFSSGLQHLNHGFAFPGDIGTPVDLGPSSSSCRFERSRSYHDVFQHNYSGGLYDSASDMIMQQPDPRLMNGHHIDGLVPNQWQMMGSDPSFLGMRNGAIDGSHPYPVPDYSNLACGVNGYGVYRPSNGL